MAPKTFEDALTKLVNDERYRSEIIANPGKLPEDFDLSGDELQVLMDVWQHTTAATDVDPHFCCVQLCCSCSC